MSGLIALLNVAGVFAFLAVAARLTFEVMS